MRPVHRSQSSSRPRQPIHRRGLVALCCALGALTGCSDVQPVAPQEQPVTDPSQLYMSLKLNHAAINLSTVPPYDTVQLVATPLDALGHPMPNLPAPIFHVQDTSKVRVTADGLLTAVAPISAPGTKVTVQLTVGAVTQFDTAIVQVQATADPPRLASVAIKPVPPDSAVWSAEVGLNAITAFLNLVGIKNNLPVPVATDSNGNTIGGLLYEHASLDPSVVNFDRWTGARTFLKPGQVRRVVRTYAYGIERADTATYTVTMPVSQDISFDPGHDFVRTTPEEVRLVPYGFVAFRLPLAFPPYTGDTVFVTFDDPAQAAKTTPAPDLLCLYLAFAWVNPCGAGDGFLADNAVFDPDIQDIVSAGNGLMIRQFPEAGIYAYHTSWGSSGRIIVTSEAFGAD